MFRSWAGEKIIYVEDKKVLIEQGNALLSKVYQADILNCGSLEDVVSNKDIESFEKWRLAVKSYLYGTPLYEDFQNLDWIIDGNRVSVKRIKMIIELLKIN